MIAGHQLYTEFNLFLCRNFLGKTLNFNGAFFKSNSKSFVKNILQRHIYILKIYFSIFARMSVDYDIGFPFRCAKSYILPFINSTNNLRNCSWHSQRQFSACQMHAHGRHFIPYEKTWGRWQSPELVVLSGYREGLN